MAIETRSVDVVQGEVVPLTINAARALDPGDVITSATATLYEATAGAVVVGGAVLRSPAWDAQNLMVTIDARVLQPRNRYRLVTEAVITAGQKEVAVITPINCVT